MRLINNFIEIKKIVPEKHGMIHTMYEKEGASKGIVVKGTKDIPDGSMLYFIKNSEIEVFGKTLLNIDNIIITK